MTDLVLTVLAGLALVCWAYGPADESIVLHLSFDENAAAAQDSSGCQDNGTVVGAVALDGVDDYMDCGILGWPRGPVSILT